MKTNASAPFDLDRIRRNWERAEDVPDPKEERSAAKAGSRSQTLSVVRSQAESAPAWLRREASVPELAARIRSAALAAYPGQTAVVLPLLDRLQELLDRFRGGDEAARGELLEHLCVVEDLCDVFAMTRVK